MIDDLAEGRGNKAPQGKCRLMFVSNSALTMAALSVRSLLACEKTGSLPATLGRWEDGAIVVPSHHNNGGNYRLSNPSPLLDTLPGRKSPAGTSAAPPLRSAPPEPHSASGQPLGPRQPALWSSALLPLNRAGAVA